MLNVLEKWQCTSLDTPVKLRDIRLHGSDPMKVSATLLANRPLQTGDLDVIKQQLEQRLEQKIELEAVLAIKR
jgi:predicted RNA-binding protein with PUA domain